MNELQAEERGRTSPARTGEQTWGDSRVTKAGVEAHVF